MKEMRKYEDKNTEKELEILRYQDRSRKYMEIHFIKTSNSYNRNNYGIATNVNILSNTNNRE